MLDCRKIMQEIKCIVCDIDGTITDNSRKAPTDVTLKVLKKVHDAGIKFGIASGRPLYQVRLNINAEMLGFKPDFVIGMNGAQLWVEDEQKEYDYFVLEPEIMRQIVKFMEPWKKQTSLWWYGDNEMLYENDDSLMSIAKEKLKKGEGIRVAQSLDELYAKPNAKVLFRLFDENDMPKIEEYVEKYPTDKWKAFKTQKALIEFANPNTSKGYTVQMYCQMQNIDLQNLAAFGDMDNDLPMIEVAGVGVAMLNGSDNMKKAAKYITEKLCIDDGLADFIEKHILKREG